MARIITVMIAVIRLPLVLITAGVVVVFLAVSICGLMMMSSLDDGGTVGVGVDKPTQNPTKSEIENKMKMVPRA